MAENKTKYTQKSVAEFLAKISDEDVRKDCRVLQKLMKDVTKKSAKMFGSSIVGFGTYHYVYDSGREGDAPLTGFSPRKGMISIYVMTGFDGMAALLKKLGKHKRSKACLYVKSLDDVDIVVLKKIVAKSVAGIRKSNPSSGR